jgi:hypothetical protein
MLAIIVLLGQLIQSNTIALRGDMDTVARSAANARVLVLLATTVPPTASHRLLKNVEMITIIVLTKVALLLQ